ncbi:hypothetical protein FNV43_RR26744 [Rhamnella rubrinervis]|uniref:Uncharacterized protein n=1 Tax=Rhamnella rubrinervis TaxID=2594499 RepID=A0A8K0DJB9_9ROSA|nr:hypothetical protein FNV43_RR26744 [Rhamnella rubrinervis]
MLLRQLPTASGNFLLPTTSYGLTHHSHAPSLTSYGSPTTSYGLASTSYFSHNFLCTLASSYGPTTSYTPPLPTTTNFFPGSNNFPRHSHNCIALQQLPYGPPPTSTAPNPTPSDNFLRPSKTSYLQQLPYLRQPMRPGIFLLTSNNILMPSSSHGPSNLLHHNILLTQTTSPAYRISSSYLSHFFPRPATSYGLKTSYLLKQLPVPSTTCYAQRRLPRLSNNFLPALPQLPTLWYLPTSPTTSLPDHFPRPPTSFYGSNNFLTGLPQLPHGLPTSSPNSTNFPGHPTTSHAPSHNFQAASNNFLPLDNFLDLPQLPTAFQQHPTRLTPTTHRQLPHGPTTSLPPT